MSLNLLVETVHDIEKMGKSIADVDWVGAESFGWFTWYEFAPIAEATNYDSGFGSQKIASDLIVHFTDGQYMDRGEYDGREWWQCHPPISRPAEHVVPTTLGGDEIMWDTLHEIHHPYNGEEE